MIYHSFLISGFMYGSISATVLSSINNLQLRYIGQFIAGTIGASCTGVVTNCIIGDVIRIPVSTTTANDAAQTFSILRLQGS